MAQAGALERGRGVIRRHGKQQLVNFAGEVGTSARRSDQATLGVDANGDDNTTAWLRVTNVSSDFPRRKLAGALVTL